MENIKVSIKIEGIAKNTVFMSEENAKKAYAMINRTLGRYMDQDMNVSPKELSVQDVKETFKNFGTKVNDILGQPESNEEYKVDTKKVAEEKSVELYKTPKEKHGVHRKTLIAFKCENCGKVGFAVLLEGEVATCRGCENAILLVDLIPVEAKCPNCGQNYNFKVKGDWMDFHKCKQCESPIDLEMHKKDKKLVSLDSRG